MQLSSRLAVNLLSWGVGELRSIPAPNQGEGNFENDLLLCRLVLTIWLLGGVHAHRDTFGKLQIPNSPPLGMTALLPRKLMY